MDFWFDMISKRSAPNVVTYTIVIDGLCKNSEIDKALYFLDCMVSKRYEPSCDL